MAYLTTIKTAIAIFPCLALLFTLPFIIFQYHKYGSINFFRALIIYSFVLYLITMYFLVILPLPKITEVVACPRMIRLIPLTFIKDFLNETSFVLGKPSTYIKALLEPCFYTVVFNLFMTVPFGMYLRYYFKCNLKKTIIYSFFLSLFFELTQLSRLYFIYPYQYRVFDVDDLIINTLGGMIGYFVMGIIKPMLPTREEIDKESLRKSKVVSGLRRIITFEFDCFLYLLIFIFLSIFIKTKKLFLITFIIYYILIPCITKGYTLGSKFLNVRLEYLKNRLINSTFRIVFLFCYYFLTPYTIFKITFLSTRYISTSITIYVYLLILIGVLIFYFINVIFLLKNKTMFYDKYFKVLYISTLEAQEKEEEKI